MLRGSQLPLSQLIPLSTRSAGGRLCPPQHLSPHFWTSKQSISWPCRCIAQGPRTIFHLLRKAKRKTSTCCPLIYDFASLKSWDLDLNKSRIHLTEHRIWFPTQSHPGLLDIPAEDRQVSYTAHGEQEILVLIALNREESHSHHQWMCLHSPKLFRHLAGI